MDFLYKLYELIFAIGGYISVGCALAAAVYLVYKIIRIIISSIDLKIRKKKLDIEKERKNLNFVKKDEDDK